MVTKGDSYYIINFAEGDRPGDLEGGGVGVAYRLLQVTCTWNIRNEILPKLTKPTKTKPNEK